MNKLFLITAFAISSGVLSSCQKESQVQEPVVLAKLTLHNKIPETAIKFELLVDNQLADSNFRYTLQQFALEGNHHIQLINAESKEVLADTTLKVLKQHKNNYTFFRTDPNDKVLFIEAINTDSVTAPPDGYLKISLANFTRHLPGNIEIIFLQDDMYTGAIDTALILTNPGKLFTEYIFLKMAEISPGNYNTQFRVALRDAITREDIAFMTDPITGEPIDWSWFIGFEAYSLGYPQKKIFSLYMFSLADDPSAPTHYSTYINPF